MLPACEVVVVKTKNGPVRVNKSDYEANPDAYGPLDKGATEKQVDTPVANTATNAPPQYFINKEGRKYFICTLTGEKASGDGIDAEGYKSEDDAKAALDALA